MSARPPSYSTAGIEYTYVYDSREFREKIWFQIVKADVPSMPAFVCIYVHVNAPPDAPQRLATAWSVKDWMYTPLASPVLVGEANPYSEDPEHALFCVPTGSAGERLQRKVLALSAGRYLDLERQNLCGKKWSAPAAREAASALLARFPPERYKFVLLGVKVAKSFGVASTPFTVLDLGTRHRAVVLPHPSSLCRVWNQAGAYEEARAVMSKEFVHIPFGMLEADW